MPMLQRIQANALSFSAVLGLAASLAAIALGVWGLVHGSVMASTLELMAQGTGASFSSTRWLTHWRLSMVSDVALGTLGAVGSFAVLRGKRWGLLLVACLLTLVVLLQAVTLLSGAAVYAFEAAEPLELLFTFVLMCACWLVLRFRQRSVSDRSAT